MTIKERLEDMADSLDDLALSELLREAIEAIEEAEGEALEHEQHADRVEADLTAANAKIEALEAQLADMKRSRDAARFGRAALESAA